MWSRYNTELSLGFWPCKQNAHKQPTRAVPLFQIKVLSLGTMFAKKIFLRLEERRREREVETGKL